MKPSRQLLIAVGVWTLLAVSAFFLGGAPMRWIWILTGVLLGLAAVVDAIRTKTDVSECPVLSHHREFEEIVPVGKESYGVTGFTLSRRQTPRWIAIYEMLDGSVEMSPYPIVIRRRQWDAAGSVLQRYSILPHRRGAFTCPGAEVEYLSRWGFWTRRAEMVSPWKIRVYPDFWDRKHYTGESMRGVAESAGILRVRRRGEGTEFRELRDYVSGDSIRHVDWRASSRRDHLVVKAFQEEQDQQILILLDGGYRLHQMEGATIQFEHALRALFRLAAVSIRHQDSVGAYLFGEEERYLTPGKGSAQYRSLLRGLYDYQSTPVPTTPGVALEKCLNRLKRRTFLLLITNLRPEDAETVSLMVPLITGRHRLMVVTLREEGARGPETVATFDDALRYGASVRYGNERAKLSQLWNRQGILTLDCGAAELSARLVNTYLALKGQGAL